MELQQIFKQRELSSDFSQYSKVYLSTTENIRGYLNSFNVENKDVLTICASGDQALSCITAGAKIVTCFDINYLTKYILILKRALILNLSKDDYLDFFDKNSYKYFSKEIYDYIKKDLNPETREFFDYIYANYHINEFNMYVFINPGLDRTGRYVNFYNNYSYYLLQSRIEACSIDFINCDIFNLINKLDHCYDYMLFSNVPDYLITNINDLNNYLDYIETLSKYLNTDGTILAAYLYEFYNDLYKSYNGNPVYNLFNSKEANGRVFKYPFNIYKIKKRADFDTNDGMLLFYK